MRANQLPGLGQSVTRFQVHPRIRGGTGGLHRRRDLSSGDDAAVLCRQPRWEIRIFRHFFFAPCSFFFNCVLLDHGDHSSATGIEPTRAISPGPSKKRGVRQLATIKKIVPEKILVKFWEVQFYIFRLEIFWVECCYCCCSLIMFV